MPSQKSSNTLQRWLIILLIVLAISLASLVPLQNNPLTNLNLRFSKYGKYAKYIAAQAKHESGNYTSELATKYNNIFGMGYPTRRPAVNNGSTPTLTEGNVMSWYRNKAQAIKDLLLWMDYKNFPLNLSSVDEYARALKERGYFTDSLENYTNALRRWMR